MGRRRLNIKRLENVKARQVKYSKRKVGVLKKAKELATLCEVDVGLVMFSPTGKPSHYVGPNKDLSSVLDKFSKVSLEDKERRKAYTMKLLNKSHTNLDSAGDPQKLATESAEELKVVKQQLSEVKEKLAEKRKILRDWKNPYNINSLEQIKIMEEHLKATLDQVKNLKIQLREKENK